MKTIIQKPILHLNSEELPHMIRQDILGDNYDEQEFDEIYEGVTRTINDPIKIDSLRQLLDQLEEKGANYVAIDFHTDHQEYELDGIYAGLATQEEIDDYYQKNKEYQLRMVKERINVLTTELSRVQNKLNELSKD